MPDEPLLDFLRRHHAVHPLELPDTQAFLENGGYAHGLSLRNRRRRFRSQLQHPLAVDMVNSAADQFDTFAWLGHVAGQKAWARQLCRLLSPRDRYRCREAARHLVRRGTRREEVTVGLLFLLFLSEPEDLEATRILARNGAFTPYSLGIISRYSPNRDQDYRDLLRILQGPEKTAIVAQFLKAPTSEKIQLALAFGFPSLQLPIWKFGRTGDFNERRFLGGAAKLWTSKPELQEALLTRPRWAALVAAAYGDHSTFREKVLKQPTLITHYFLNPNAEEQDWSELILPALESEDGFERRQGWMVARGTGHDLDILAENRLVQAPEDYVAWEETAPFLSRVDLFERVQIDPEPGGPAFELGLCPQRWKWARVLEPVLRGLTRFPGYRLDLVAEGLTHPVIAVRMAALGLAAVWPEDHFQEMVQAVSTSDPVSAVRAVASKVASRTLLQPPYLDLCRKALSEMTELPPGIASQLETSFVYETTRPEMLVADVKFVPYLTARGVKSISQDTSLGICIVDLDPQKQRLLCIEII